MKSLNDDLQMRSDWTMPLCTGAGTAAQRARAETASDAETRGAAAPRDPVLDQPGRCDRGPVPRHRHHRRGGQAPAPAFHRHRAPPGLCRGGLGPARGREAAPRRARSIAPPTGRETPRIAFGSFVERGIMQARHAAHRQAAPHRRRSHRRGHAGLRRRIAARSIRLVRRCRTRPPAMAGPSGISSATARWCRWMCCARKTSRSNRKGTCPARQKNRFELAAEIACIPRNFW